MRSSSSTLVALLSLACFALLPSPCAASPRNQVRVIDGFDMLQRVARRQHKLIVLMYEGGDASAKAFQPWLFALAQLVPHFAVTTFDVTHDKGLVQQAFDVTTTPVVKLLARDSPKGERVIDYRGPLEFEALLGWAKAVVKGESHALSAFGAEPLEETAAAGKNSAGGKGVMGGLQNLPESVRNMATTMVRERRLQKLLKEYGDERVAKYNAAVSQRYQQIVAEEGLDLSDKFAVQEANRKAREVIREEILADAPDHVRDEVEGEVQMGDMRQKDEV